MAPEKSGESFAEEVEDRLENLFGEDEAEEVAPAESAETADSPLRELKAIVLSIDWEITDEVMLRFVEQIADLQDVFKDDRVVLIFLQLLGSIGEYIRTNLGKSHPDSFKMLSSLYKNLALVVHQEEMPDTEKRKILSTELAKYKKLKGRLIPADDPEEPLTLPADAEVKPASPKPKTDFNAALDEIKQFFQAELQALRNEIQELKKTLSAKK